MRRMNVQFSQIEECIRTSLFAVDGLPRNPPLVRGEPLLLQLVKADALRLEKLARRVEFALIFDHVSEDRDGSISRLRWPNAGKVWRYILHCSETVAVLPFSLEKLGLSKDYGGQTNAMYIEPEDTARIVPYLKHSEQAQSLPAATSVRDLQATIRNHDVVVRLSPMQSTQVSVHERRLRDPWLGDALKVLYDHKCQICVNDFRPRYGVPYADTRFITPVKSSADLVSQNLLVLCPNHNAIVGAAGAQFDKDAFAYRYENGLVERITLRDHLLLP